MNSRGWLQSIRDSGVLQLAKSGPYVGLRVWYRENDDNRACLCTDTVDEPADTSSEYKLSSDEEWQK